MNILISAYSCNPYLGSEDAVGWNWILQYSRNAGPQDKIYVITKRFNEESMIKGLAEFNVNNVELWISEPPRALDWFREKHSMFHHMYYGLWQKYAYKYVKNKKIKFDIIHHVTMTDWRFTGYFSNFKDAYTIFGPVGGGQEIPECLKQYQTKKVMEIVRSIANRTRKFIPSYVKNLNSYNAIYVVNEETLKYVSRITDNPTNIYVEPDCAVAEPYRNIHLKSDKDCSEHKLMFSGRYDLPRKGAYFLIDALKNLPQDFNYSLDMYGGPAECELKKYISECGLSDKVHLIGRIPYTEMKLKYSQYDAFVFSSLRETGGNVLFEAMSHGLPIVGFDTSFNKILKDKECGIFINTNISLDALKTNYAKAIQDVFGDKYLVYSNNAYSFANNSTWEKKYKRVESVRLLQLSSVRNGGHE